MWSISGRPESGFSTQLVSTVAQRRPKNPLCLQLHGKLIIILQYQGAGYRDGAAVKGAYLAFTASQREAGQWAFRPATCDLAVGGAA